MYMYVCHIILQILTSKLSFCQQARGIYNVHVHVFINSQNVSLFHQLMPLEELSQQLGATTECFSTPKPKPKMKDKLLSFLSDSCYLSSPLCLSGSDTEPESEPEYYIDGGGDTRCGSDGRQSLSPSSSSLFCSLSGSAKTCGSTSSHSTSLSPGLEQWSCLSQPGSSAALLPLPTPHHLSSTSPLLHNHLITSTAGLDHQQTLATPLIPVNSTNSCTEPLSSSGKTSCPGQLVSRQLTRHPSLKSCNIQCLPGLTEKTDRAHVSCPDFHSCSTDMELGSLSQDEGNDMDISSSADTEPRAESSPVIDFNLPPIREPNIYPLQFTHQTTSREKATHQNTLPRITPITDHPGDRSTHSRAQSKSPPMARKPGAKGRNPLQPLHNTPRALISRQSGGGREKQKVASSSQWQPRTSQCRL